jgi:hypothetical protein
VSEKGYRDEEERGVKRATLKKCAIHINVIHVINLERQYKEKYNGSVYRELIAGNMYNIVPN